MGMISNFTSFQPVYWNNILKIIFGRQLMSFLCREMESHFQPTTSYGGVLGTAMSCQPGVVGDPERTLIQDFASISRPASAALPAGRGREDQVVKEGIQNAGTPSRTASLGD